MRQRFNVFNSFKCFSIDNFFNAFSFPFHNRDGCPFFHDLVSFPSYKLTYTMELKKKKYNSNYILMQMHISANST